MKTKELSDRIEEQLTLLETNNYPYLLKARMIGRVAELMSEYTGSNFSKYYTRLREIEK